jgi:hypothetical protein
MSLYNQAATGKIRKGDTRRTSSQGRKLASGGDPNKKGAPKVDEITKTPVAELKKEKKQKP